MERTKLSRNNTTSRHSNKVLEFVLESVVKHYHDYMGNKEDFYFLWTIQGNLLSSKPKRQEPESFKYMQSLFKKLVHDLKYMAIVEGSSWIHQLPDLPDFAALNLQPELQEEKYEHIREMIYEFQQYRIYNHS